MASNNVGTRKSQPGNSQNAQSGEITNIANPRQYPSSATRITGKGHGSSTAYSGNRANKYNSR